MTDDDGWDELAKQAESGQLALVRGTVLRGEAAARGGRAALLAATGTDTFNAGERIAPDTL